MSACGCDDCKDYVAPTPEPMNPALKTKWLKALRSGKYAQGLGALKKELGDGAFNYCCLGVLGDVMETEGLCRSRKNAKDEDHSYQLVGTKHPDSWHDCMPSQEMEDAAGLSLDVAGQLAEMNDSKRMSFAQIADWVEENL